MKILTRHIMLITITIEMMMSPMLGFSQYKQKDNLPDPINIVIEDLNKQLKLNPTQLNKTNQLYKICTDTLSKTNIDFEIELRKLLTQEQVEKLNSYLKSGSSRNNINYCTKK